MATTRRLRTSNYSQEARERLGEAVARAREALGYKHRPPFARVADISLRSLAAIENGESGVGGSTLRIVAGALPNWDEDTPRTILEGGPIPPVAEQPLATTTATDASDDPALPRVLTMTRAEIFEEAERLDRTIGDGAGDEFVQWAMSARQRAAERQRNSHMPRGPQNDHS